MTAAFKTSTETDTPVARTLPPALMPPRGSADVSVTIQGRRVGNSGRAVRVDRGGEAFRRDT